MLLSGSRTYDLPITSSDALPLIYTRLVGARIRGYSEKSERSFVGVEPTTYRLLVRILLKTRTVGD